MTRPDAEAAAEGQPGDRLPAPGRTPETSQVPFTPLLPEAMEQLAMDEVLAFEAAVCAVAGDQKPSLEVIATLVLTVQRLITEPRRALDAAVDAAIVERVPRIEWTLRQQIAADLAEAGHHEAAGVVLKTPGPHALATIGSEEAEHNVTP